MATRSARPPSRGSAALDGGRRPSRVLEDCRAIEEVSAPRRSAASTVMSASGVGRSSAISTAVRSRLVTGTPFTMTIGWSGNRRCARMPADTRSPVATGSRGRRGTPETGRRKSAADREPIPATLSGGGGTALQVVGALPLPAIVVVAGPRQHVVVRGQLA